ncbi:Gfo/Idh/MocA family oxidoreductase [Nitratireductor mangrovi]|uniref:Gfo/Idh/MocA family oxidoreductase n=1 Tax=Nitratireductor mangrovi TaxID=2599600 RepID=A0A5B8KVL3_9HYPH|nr:Gfo/Idh/MocA family oxidoreductase [Nitratireductor mangrovi]QDY99716.1 Gfo/Idh/MocA family oxidoreductase [Nitratireductor mangrovi]
MSAAFGDSPIRVALAGAGMISVYHLRAWQAAGIPVVAVCDIDRGKAESRAAEFGIDRIYDDPEALFRDGGFDVVDIAASVGAHAPVTRLAADQGVHVMLQKPMTETVAEAEALVEAVGDRVRFMVHENYRFRPHYMTVRRWIDEGRIGKVRHAAISCRGSGLCPRDGAEPFLLERQPYLRGFRRNLVFETMIHHLDVLRCLCGPLRVIAARLSRLAEDLPGEDTAAILLEGDDGLIATADGSICAPGYPQLHGDRLEIIGTRATVIMDYNRVYLVGAEGEAEEVDLLGRYQECFDAVIASFLTGLRHGTPFETDRLDNLETLRLMESAYRAAGVEIAA